MAKIIKFPTHDRDAELLAAYERGIAQALELIDRIDKEESETGAAIAGVIWGVVGRVYEGSLRRQAARDLLESTIEKIEKNFKE